MVGLSLRSTEGLEGSCHARDEAASLHGQICRVSLVKASFSAKRGHEPFNSSPILPAIQFLFLQAG